MEFSGLGHAQKVVVKRGGPLHFDWEATFVIEVDSEGIEGDRILSVLADAARELEVAGLAVKSAVKPKRATPSTPHIPQSLQILVTSGGAVRLEEVAWRKSATIEGRVVKLVLDMGGHAHKLLQVACLVDEEECYEIQISPTPEAQTDLFTSPSPPPDIPAAKHAAKLLEGLKAGSRPFEEAVQVDVEEAIREAKAKAQADEVGGEEVIFYPMGQPVPVELGARADALLEGSKLKTHPAFPSIRLATARALEDGVVEEVVQAILWDDKAKIADVLEALRAASKEAQREAKARTDALRREAEELLSVFRPKARGGVEGLDLMLTIAKKLGAGVTVDQVADVLGNKKILARDLLPKIQDLLPLPPSSAPSSPPEALALSVRAQAEALLGRHRPKLLKHERVRELVDAIEGALLEGAVEEDFLHDFKLPSLTVPSLISSAQHQGKKARERALEEAAKSASLSLPPSNVITLPGPSPMTEGKSARG